MCDHKWLPFVYNAVFPYSLGNSKVYAPLVPDYQLRSIICAECSKVMRVTASSPKRLGELYQEEVLDGEQSGPAKPKPVDSTLKPTSDQPLLRP